MQYTTLGSGRRGITVGAPVRRAATGVEFAYVLIPYTADERRTARKPYRFHLQLVRLDRLTQ